MAAAVYSQVGLLSVYDFSTPVPYPFGTERTGWGVQDVDRAVELARKAGARVQVEPFNDPIGRDAVIQFPGGVGTQLWRETEMTPFPALETLPENRVYVSRDVADEFVRSYAAFTSGTVTSDDRQADGAQIGRPDTTFRRIGMTSPFGNTAVFATDGHLPYPFGQEITGFTVPELSDTLAKAEAAEATVLWGPRTVKGRSSAVARFPGGFLAEIHDGAFR